MPLQLKHLENIRPLQNPHLNPFFCPVPLQSVHVKGPVPDPRHAAQTPANAVGNATTNPKKTITTENNNRREMRSRMGAA